MEERRIKIVDLEYHVDDRGELIIATTNKEVPFPIKRIFYIYGNPDKDRGGHAHKKCEQFFIPIRGEIVIAWDCGFARMRSSLEGLYVPPGITIGMHFESGAILLVLASEEFDPDDYI